MNAKLEQSPKQQETSSSLDHVKLLMAVVLAASSLFSYYYFSGVSIWLRLAGLMVCLAATGGLVLWSNTGREFIAFFSSSVMELRRVVWPSKNETWRTTLLVVVVVLIAAIFFAMVDASLAYIVGLLV